LVERNVVEGARKGHGGLDQSRTRIIYRSG